MSDQKPPNPRRLYIRLTTIPPQATAEEAFEIIKAAEASTRLELERAEDAEDDSQRPEARNGDGE